MTTTTTTPELAPALAEVLDTLVAALRARPVLADCKVASVAYAKSFHITVQRGIHDSKISVSVPTPDFYVPRTHRDRLPDATTKVTVRAGDSYRGQRGVAYKTISGIKLGSLRDAKVDELVDIIVNALSAQESAHRIQNAQDVRRTEVKTLAAGIVADTGLRVTYDFTLAPYGDRVQLTSYLSEREARAAMRAVAAMREADRINDNAVDDCEPRT